MIDAVIRTGGKQYRVHEGSVLSVATMDAEPGSRVELRDVLMLTDGSNITIGNPLVADAVVVAEVLQHGRGRKVINFKYKAKVRYRRKRGHRQAFTRLSVKEILPAGATRTESSANKRPSKAAIDKTASESPAETASAPAAARTPRARRSAESETPVEE